MKLYRNELLELFSKQWPNIVSFPAPLPPAQIKMAGGSGAGNETRPNMAIVSKQLFSYNKQYVQCMFSCALTVQCFASNLSVWDRSPHEFLTRITCSVYIPFVIYDCFTKERK